MTKIQTLFSTVLMAGTLALFAGSVQAESLLSESDLMAGFDMNETVGQVVAQPLDLVAKQANGHINTQEEGRPTTDIYSTLTKNGNIALTLEISGFADDSVKGQRTRWILQQIADNKLKVLQSGQQVSCWRGSTPHTWVAGRCP